MILWEYTQVLLHSTLANCSNDDGNTSESVTNEINFPFFKRCRDYSTRFKVPMKGKLSLGSYKIYPFKHGISKFEIAGVKIADFVSAQKWAILPSKMVFESRGQNAR